MSITFTLGYDHVNVETAADGSGSIVPAQSVNVGGILTVYAIGRAADNTFIGNAPATWSLVNKSGGVVDANLVVSGNTKSATFTGLSAGTANIRAVVTGVATSTDSGTITVLPYSPQNLVWTGQNSADWDLVALNWTNQLSGLNTNFNQTDVLRFDDTSVQTSVNVAAQMSQGGMTVDTVNTYTFSGSGLISGNGNLNKNGAGILALNTTNTYSGLTTISNGTIILGNAMSLGLTNTGTVIKAGATLDLNGKAGTAEPVTIEGAGVGGAGAIVNSGAAIVNNSFNGAAVTFSGDTTLGGANRWDFNGGTLAGNGYKLTKVGANGLVLTGNGNTDLGDIEIQSGGLTLVANVTLGRTGSNVVIYPSTTLDFFAVNNTNPLVKNIIVTNGTISTSSGTTWLNTPILFDTSLTLGGAANTLVSNTITGGVGSLTKTGAGTISLFTANNFSGGTANNGGILTVRANGALGTGLVTVTAPAASQATRIDLGNGVNFTNDVIAVGRNTGFNGVIYVPGTNDVATNSGSITCNGGNAPSGAGGHLCGPSGAGMLHVLGPIIQGTDTPSIRNGFVRVYGGGSGSGFNINQGTTSLGATDGINPAASLTLAASGTTIFDLNGFNQTLAGLTRGNPNITIVTNNAASLSTLTLNIAADQTFSGVLAGKIALIKSGANILTSSGTNTYTGNTTVSQGTLVIQQPTIASNSTVSISNSAVLQLDFAVTNTVASLVIGGTNQAPGLYSVVTSAPYLAGTGFLMVPSPIATYSTNINVSISGANLTVSWPATHLGWILDQQTNSLAVGLSTNWQPVVGSENVTGTNFPVNVAPSQFFRLRKP